MNVIAFQFMAFPHQYPVFMVSCNPAYSAFPTLISITPLVGSFCSSSRIAPKFSSVTTVYSGQIFRSYALLLQWTLNSWICSLVSCDLYLPMNSAQLGDEASVLVICLLSAFKVGLEDVSRMRNSWRLEGGIVKRMGNDIVVMLI